MCVLKHCLSFIFSNFFGALPRCFPDLPSVFLLSFFLFCLVLKTDIHLLLLHVHTFFGRNDAKCFLPKITSEADKDEEGEEEGRKSK